MICYYVDRTKANMKGSPRYGMKVAPTPRHYKALSQYKINNQVRLPPSADQTELDMESIPRLDKLETNLVNDGTRRQMSK